MHMDFLPEEIDRYCGQMTEAEPELLREVARDTQANVLMPRMLSGHLQGRVLSMLSHMIRPRCIVEIGTFTGYSALCLAEGLAHDGVLHTFEVNDELETRIRSAFDRSTYADRIRLYIGPALERLSEVEGPIDLVFIDADKTNYSTYYDAVFDRVRPGGFIIADNVLWSGKIIEDPEGMDADTRALYDYNQKVSRDSRVQTVLFPIRDGLLIARKK